MGTIRRVVTGNDAAGKAVFVSDTEIEATTVSLSPTEYLEVWRGDGTPELPATGSNGARTTFFPGPAGYRFFVLTVPAGEHTVDMETLDLDAALAEFEEKLPGILAWNEFDDPGMHTTDTVDMEYVAAGQITLELDDGEMRVCSAGDTIIQNGTRHRWHNHGTEDAVLVVTMVGGIRSS